MEQQARYYEVPDMEIYMYVIGLPLCSAKKHISTAISPTSKDFTRNSIGKADANSSAMCSRRYTRQI